MCTFFSFLSNGKGKYYYINAEERKAVIKKGENPDSHSYIVKHFQNKELLSIGNKIEDKLNKYEYIITDNGWEFIKDQINGNDDSESAEKWVKKLFSKIDYNMFDSHYAYHYCYVISNDPDMRKRITDSDYAYWYCLYISNDPDMRKRITDSRWAYQYCRYVSNDPDMRVRITNPTYIRMYNEIFGGEHERSAR